MIRLSVLLVITLGGVAAAEVSDVEVPTLMVDPVEVTTTEAPDEALDLANIVRSAAKNVTTIQEAPAIVTVITADDIRDRQFQDFSQITDMVPGWQRAGVANSFFPQVTVRGQVQAVQFLHDGLSLFDPLINIPTISRVQAMELIKRVEIITGPGGVLWGSNSLLGIINVITKDAEDIEGVEVGSTLGHGPGDRLMARAYVMAGRSDLLDGKLKLFGHGSVETYQGPEQTNPALLFHQPLPQPNSANTYGPLTQTEAVQSLIVNLDGKVTYGKLQLRFEAPFGRMGKALAIAGNPVRATLPEDSRCMNNGTVDPSCLDNLRASRSNTFDSFDRYIVAEYRDRFAGGRAGIALKTYAQQFARSFNSLQVLTPSSLVQGGLAFDADVPSYRIGGALDADLEIVRPLRVLYGFELFNEVVPDNTTGSIQGPGVESTFPAPYDLTRLPLPCPRMYDRETMAVVPIKGCPVDFAFATDRTVTGAYLNPQLRPSKRWIFDVGARAQVAPAELGQISYPVTFTTAGTIVWNFIRNWHVKVNYAQGFRPPVFNATSASGEAVQIGGDPHLRVEHSDATQVELNARIFKGERSIRELSFRVDGSYTRLQNLIQVNEGRYSNSGDRSLSSVEFLGKLYIHGGHRLELAYTWLRGATADRGRLRSLPEHWFNFSTVFNLISGQLTGTTGFRVVGAAEDPNRLVEYRGSSYAADGTIVDPVTVSSTDLVVDLLPPIAELSAGLLWTPIQKLLIRATVFNALNQHAYQPDFYFDYEPHFQYLPNPYERLRGYLTATYQY